jgi:lipoprotein-anchoring transpeptidase ErfK/SrfK
MKNWKKILGLGIGLIGIIFIFSFFLSFRKANPFKSLKQSQEFKTLTKKAEEAEKADNLPEAIGYLEKLSQGLGQHKKVYAVWLNLGRLYEKNNQLLEAKSALEKVVAEAQDGRLIQEAQMHLGQLNIAILFSPLLTEDAVVYEVKEGDSLSKIARQFHTTVELLMQANRLKSNNLRLGSRLKVSTAKFSVFVDKSQNALTLKANEQILKVYTVSTGLDNVTPVGTFKIVNKLVNPVWYKEGVVIPAGSLENILGSRWLGFSQTGYGIHGTTQPETIGKHITQGCVRMYNQDVEELYTILPVGTEVVIME